MDDSHSPEKMGQPLGPIVLISIGLVLGFFVGLASGFIFSEPTETEISEETNEFGFDSELTNLPQFNEAELAEYTGLDGTLCYVAWSGYVFDVSKVSSVDLECGTNLDSQIEDGTPDAQLFYDLIPLAIFSGELQTLTAETLAPYNGKNGALCYTVYEGKVYDVTSSDTFENGEHPGGVTCGQDDSAKLENAPHGANVFDGFEVVAFYETSQSELPAYTAETLAPFNGKDGALCYTVYEGNVYDVSSSDTFENGEHPGGVTCGQDDSAKLENAPHGGNVFEGFEIVGTYQ